jgi:LPXTG-site transpeptidase (sortase) family protein
VNPQGNPRDLDKILFSTSVGNDNDPDVDIGEILTYQVSVVIEPGVYDNVTLVDTLAQGLAFVRCVSISPSNLILTTSVTGGYIEVCDADADPDPDPDSPIVSEWPVGSIDPVDVDRHVIFELGTLTNGDTVDRTLTVTYEAIVLDNADNVDGESRSNSAVFTWSGGTLAPDATTVNIVEPKLIIVKAADNNFIKIGSELTFTLTVRHAPGSSTDAFDVEVEDTLPIELAYIDGSIDCTLGAQDPDPASCYYDPLTFTVHARWSVFALGLGNSIIRFRVQVVTLPAAGNITNTAFVDWTSLPGDLDPSPYTANQYSIERNYDPGSLIDIYRTVASRALIPLGGRRGKRGGGGGFLIPVTGFAPGRITYLNPLSVSKYDASNGLVLDLPTLGIKLPIVGVRLEQGLWNIDWLWDQAGWLEYTAYPTYSGNSVITAHVVLSDGKPGPFAKLNDLRIGEYVFVDYNGYRYIYKVRSSYKVKPDDIGILRHKERPWLTLVTCADYDEETQTYRQRVVVQAELINIEEMSGQ